MGSSNPHLPGPALEVTEVLENISDGFFACDRQHRFVYVNAAAERQLDRSRTELLGKNLYDVFPELGAADGIDARLLREAVRTGTSVEREYYHPPSGHWFRGRVCPTPWGVAMYFHDVTRSRLTREALGAAERQYRTLIDSIDQGYCVFEMLFDEAGRPTDYRFLETNRAFEAQTGFVDVVGQRMRALAPGLEQSWFDAYGRVVRTGEPVRFEAQARPLNRWFDVYAFRVGPAEACRGAALFRDVSERRQADDALREADRRKDEFLAILAHELRNPLAPLRTGLEIMRLGTADAVRAEQVRSMMVRQVDHMVALVDDLMDVSRISRGSIVLERRPVELTTVIRSALESCDPIIRQSGHEVSIVLPAETVHVDGDRNRLVQALGNLLINAAKYTDPGGHIAVTLEHAGEFAIVRVKDNGVGIPADKLSSVFDLFMQVDSAVDRTQGGLEIGLTIVRQLVELHGGTIEVRSDGPGKGSEFIVRLPLARAPAAEPEKPILQADSVRARRILVVDDNQDAARAMATMLELLGHQVELAYDGVQALAVAEAGHPEIILMDLGMPHLNGYAAAQRLRRTGWGKSAMLIAVTGWGQEADRAASEEAGFDHHLVKPVDIDAVQALVAQLDSR